MRALANSVGDGGGGGQPCFRAPAVWVVVECLSDKERQPAFPGLGRPSK